ncbi:MAG: hypothetical protein AB1397_07770 [bacterium]
MNGKTFTEIKGWRETRYLPRLGKIRLGIKGISRRTGREYPIEIDYFYCPPEVKAIHGEQPKILDIMFPSDDPTIIIPFCYKMYGANNRLKCKGNGEEALYWDTETRELKEKKCPCEYLGSKDPRNSCDKRGHLMVILPLVSLGGVYQIDTGSGANINRILDAIAYWQTMVGRCRGIPLTLERVPEKILSPDGKMNIHYLFRFGCKMKVEDLNKAIENTKQILAIDYKIEPPKEEGMLDDTPIEYIDEEDIPTLPQEIKPPQEKNVEDDENTPIKSYRERLGDLMKEVYKDDLSAMQQELLKLTSFVNKEGKEIVGETSLKSLSDAQAKVAFYKFRKEIEEEEKQKSEGKLFEEELKEEDRQRKIDSIKENQQRLNELGIDPFVIKQIFTSEGIKEGLNKANDEQLDEIKKQLEQLVERKERIHGEQEFEKKEVITNDKTM